jgi:SpoVK/Ycf46/Vps4 family AAA+-type ATPase
MSQEEIENVLSLSMIEHRCFNIKTILDRKRQIIRATGFMDFIHPEPIDQLGGLENLKDYIFKRKVAFEPNSNKPKLRSILIVGFPGTGKSLAVKCVSSIFDWPGISLDVGSLKGGLVGETEKNTRIACKTIDAFGKAVVMLDEIEKAFAGGNKGSSTGDSGVSAGMLGYFLTWMQERTSEGILIATANDLDKLPPEFLRAGRWDTVFFVDLPNRGEIKSIIQIMNGRYNSELPNDTKFIERLFNEGWTGAEIEQLAKDSHFDSIDVALKNIPLLSTMRKNDMNEIRNKAKLYRKASAEDILGKESDVTLAKGKLNLSKRRKLSS